MAEAKRKFREQDVVRARKSLGLPAAMPAGLEIGDIRTVDGVRTFKPPPGDKNHYTLPAVQEVHLIGDKPDRWYGACWFELYLKS